MDRTTESQDGSPLRVLVIKNFAAPNTNPVFEELGARDDCVLRVLYETETEANRRWAPTERTSFDSETLDSRTLHLPWLAPESFVHIPRQPLKRIVAFRPDVVVASGGVWSSPLNAAAMFGRRLGRWAFVPWWGEFQNPWRSRLGRIVEPWKRLFVSGGDAWLAYSRRAAWDAARLGADPERVIVAPNTPRPPESRSVSDARRRGTGGTRFFYSGQLIERKGIEDLLNAFEGMNEGELWIAGDGPLRPLVEARVRTNDRLRYLGHLDWRSLHDTYEQIDVLVLPSLYEVWGLVVNEAAEHGLPALVSDQVGAAETFVATDHTGAVFRAGNSEALRQSMGRLNAWGPADYERCAELARERAADWSIGRAADAVVAASKLARSHRFNVSGSDR